MTTGGSPSYRYSYTPQDLDRMHSRERLGFYDYGWIAWSDIQTRKGYIMRPFLWADDFLQFSAGKLGYQGPHGRRKKQALSKHSQPVGGKYRPWVDNDAVKVGFLSGRGWGKEELPRGSREFTCQVCTSVFVAKREHVKTCSPKCRKRLSRNVTLSTKGGRSEMETTAPTIAERITAAELELARQKEITAEVARQVGLTFDDAGVTEAVERFLNEQD